MNVSSRVVAVLAVTAVLFLSSDLYGQRRSNTPTRRQQAVSKSTNAGSSKKDLAQQRREIEQLRDAAKDADSITEITHVLSRFKETYESGIEDEYRAYLLKLGAWLFVRRGEEYAKEAAMSEGDEAVTNEKLALKDFSTSIQWAPSWRAYHNRGVSRAMLGDYQKAISDFNIAIKQNRSKYSDTYFNRAEIFAEMEEFELAERDYDRAWQIDSTDIEALVGRGHARYQLGKTSEALRDFDEALDLDPKNPAVYADRGDLHAFLGEWSKAAKDYQTAVRLNNKLGRAYQSMAWMMATCPEQKFRDRGLALKAANRAIELDGQSDYRYLDTLAAAQANNDSFPEAEETVRKAMQIAPEEVVSELKDRLSLYQANRAYRERR